MVLDEAPDLERRFGGLRRLYGVAGYERLRGARVGVVGLGGVGSWSAEALARSGIAELTLFDLDHVAESNINRQVQALSATLGQAKAQALVAGSTVEALQAAEAPFEVGVERVHFSAARRSFAACAASDCA